MSANYREMLWVLDEAMAAVMREMEYAAKTQNPDLHKSLQPERARIQGVRRRILRRAVDEIEDHLGEE